MNPFDFPALTTRRRKALNDMLVFPQVTAYPPCQALYPSQNQGEKLSRHPTTSLC